MVNLSFKKIVHLDTVAKELAIILNCSSNSTSSEQWRATSIISRVYNFDQYTQRTKNFVQTQHFIGKKHPLH
jgi:hypothetical protein